MAITLVRHLADLCRENAGITYGGLTLDPLLNQSPFAAEVRLFVR